MIPDEVQVLLREASRLFHEGRMAEAAPAYRRLLATWPDLPNSWFNLAMALRATRDFSGALDAYARALELGVDAPEEAHLQRGVILADDLGQAAAARAELEAALALNPRYLPALLNLGNHHEDVGDREGARAAYARALDVAPGDALALARLVGVSDAAGAGDSLLARVREAINAADRAEDRADLGFALGDALDRSGDYDAAFAAFAAANRESAAIAAAAGLRFDRADFSRLIDRIIAAFPEPAGKTGAEEAAPIFLCGMFRSGSTLAETILSRHSGIVAGGELDVLPALIADSPQPYPESAARAPDATIAALRDRYLAETAARRCDSLLVDKRPDNLLHIGLIKRMFPYARIIHTVRDPRDTAISIFALHAGPALGYATDLADIAHVEAEYRRLMAHWRALYPDDIHTLDYDRLIRDPDREVRATLDFIGVSPEPGLLDPGAADAAVRTASNWQVRQALYTRSSGRWRHYRAPLNNAGFSD